MKALMMALAFSAAACPILAIAEDRPIDTACQNCTSPKRVFLAWRLERISIGLGGQPANAQSSSPGLSADGRFVVFTSEASNLVEGDTNNARDIFVRDRKTARTERVSIGSAGEQANDGSDSPSISADGRYVAFRSMASNLVADDTNQTGDIFIHDRQTGITKRVSLLPDGSQAVRDEKLFKELQYFYSFGITGGWPISGDGQHVVFNVNSYRACIPLCVGESTQRYIRDVSNGTTTPLNLPYILKAFTSPAFSHSYGYGNISTDGRYLAYTTRYDSLDSLNGEARILDVHTGVEERINLTQDGNPMEGCGASRSSSFDRSLLGTSQTLISPDGTQVAFSSFARNLAPTDTNGASDIFVYNRGTGAIRRVSVAANNAQAESDGENLLYGPGSALEGISGDGRFIAFSSVAPNLVPNDHNQSIDVFIHDMETHNTWSVSLASDGATANGHSYSSILSNDGHVIAFVSEASNLLAKDTNKTRDIFVADISEPPRNPYRPGNLAVSEKIQAAKARMDPRLLRYTLTVRNRAQAQASKVVLNHYFSEEVDIVALPKKCRKIALPASFPENCAAPKSRIRCAMGLIPAKQRKHVKLLIKPKAAGTLVGTAEVLGNINDRDWNDNTASVTKTVEP